MKLYTFESVISGVLDNFSLDLQLNIDKVNLDSLKTKEIELYVIIEGSPENIQNLVYLHISKFSFKGYIDHSPIYQLFNTNNITAYICI